MLHIICLVAWTALVLVLEVELDLFVFDSEAAWLLCLKGKVL